MGVLYSVKQFRFAGARIAFAVVFVDSSGDLADKKRESPT